MTIDDLQSMQKRRTELQRLQNKRMELMARISSPTSPGLSNAPIRTGIHDLSDDFARIDQIDREYEKALAGYLKLWTDCINALDSMGLSARSTVILHYRYLLGRKWSYIAEQLGLTRQQIHKLYRKALEELQEKDQPSD